MPETDLNRLLKLMAEYYKRIPQAKRTLGENGLAPERVIEELADSFLDPQHGRYCHGYGDPHIWADSDDSREASFYRSCLMHPHRRQKDRRASEASIQTS